MDHCVKVHLPFSDQFGTGDEFDLMAALSDEMAEAIEAAEAGEFDGNDIGGGECTLYMYGPDADRLCEIVVPFVQASPLGRGAYLVKRYGDVNDPNAREVRVQL